MRFIINTAFATHCAFEREREKEREREREREKNRPYFHPPGDFIRRWWGKNIERGEGRISSVSKKKKGPGG